LKSVVWRIFSTIGAAKLEWLIIAVGWVVIYDSDRFFECGFDSTIEEHLVEKFSWALG